MAYGLSEDKLAKLQKTFEAYPNIERVVLFGSRAMGTHKEFSDVDICLEGKDLTRLELADISRAIDDLLLPYFFDILLLDKIKNENLITHIKTQGVILYERKSKL